MSSSTSAEHGSRQAQATWHQLAGTYVNCTNNPITEIIVWDTNNLPATFLYDGTQSFGSRRSAEFTHAYAVFIGFLMMMFPNLSPTFSTAFKWLSKVLLT